MYLTVGWTMGAERKATRPSRRPATAQRGSPDREAGWSVEFEIDSALRVTEREVQVLETWLGKQLDALFETPRSSQNHIAVPDEAKDPLMRKRG